ncbi:MAG: glutamate racemase [Panacagrimonas sp.]
MDGPIGVFDSGVGGLSVLRELRRELPQERFLYYADSGHCPYGGKSPSEIQSRAIAITGELIEAGAKLIVVACNTATIAAVEHLRAHYPVPFVGMEPAVKPACALTKTGVVAVLATGAALGGEKFHRLVDRHAQGVKVITQPCPGLVECVEMGDLDGARPQLLVEHYLAPLRAADADVFVLGCTHYPFLRRLIEKRAGEGSTVLDTAAAVARHVRRVLTREGLNGDPGFSGDFDWRTSGDRIRIAPIVERLMGGFGPTPRAAQAARLLADHGTDLLG